MSVHRVRARNLATASANRIHDDSVARRFGFAGGLVPGAEIYAYLAHVPAATWGRGWLERGTLHARFVRPVYDGRAIEVVTEEAAGATMSLALRDDGGTTCATASASIERGPSRLPDPAGYPAPSPPASPPPADPDTLSNGVPLGAVDATFSATKAAEYLEAIGEDVALFDRDGLAHPGWLIRRANRLLARNFALGPWIHVESRVRHGAVVTDGDRVSARGRVTATYERKGHGFVELDVLLVVNDDVPAAHVHHVAIYRPRPAPEVLGPA